jgi:prevent-host-death family protein
MNRIGIREAKAQLSRLLRDVHRGQEWIITERGRPIAKLSPVGHHVETDEEWLVRLEREGRLIPPPPRAQIPRPLDIEPSDIAQRFLREDRDAAP